MRTVPLWRGITDDTKIPDRVRLRVFEKHGGCCYLTGRKIRPGDQWDLDHIVSLANGGLHSEDNLAPALKAPHKIKSAQDRRQQAKSDRIRKRHLGFKKSGKKIPYRRFDGSPVNPNRSI